MQHAGSEICPWLLCCALVSHALPSLFAVLCRAARTHQRSSRSIREVGPPAVASVPQAAAASPADGAPFIQWILCRVCPNKDARLVRKVSSRRHAPPTACHPSSSGVAARESCVQRRRTYAALLPANPVYRGDERGHTAGPRCMSPSG
jgi:hypothetical protein